MFNKGAKTPDLAVMDLTGRERRLHELRRRSHALLLCDPAGEQWDRWRERIAAESARWTWLELQFLRPMDPPAVAAGTYLINRWGYVIEHYPEDGWDFDRIEKDLLVFEAQNCCGLPLAP